MNVATNGLIRIPYEEFENMPVGIAICGQSQNRFIAAWEREEEFFSIALKNYKMTPELSGIIPWRPVVRMKLRM